jgi:membrane dipeptidase
MAYGFIDMHCDSLLKGIIDGQLYDHPGHMFDVSRMVLAGQGVQFFAVFFPPRPSPTSAKDQMQFPEDDILFEKAATLLQDTVAAHADIISMAYNAADIDKNAMTGRCSAILTIEDARAVDGDLTRLRRFYEAGVRVMGLTWNHPNCFGYPNSDAPEIMRRGLSVFGRAAIEEMNVMGMLIDVSHLSDGGFFDVAAVSSKPFAATHSDCRALCNNPRNLTDEMIRLLAAKGSVAGVNFGPQFLSADGTGESRVEDICRHVLHFINKGGEDCVGLGTDFDGISGHLEIGDPTEMQKLFNALRHAGLSERQIEKFAFGNVMRLLRDTL